MGREKKPTERKERAKRADPGGRERGMRRVERSRECGQARKRPTKRTFQSKYEVGIRLPYQDYKYPICSESSVLILRFSPDSTVKILPSQDFRMHKLPVGRQKS